MGNGAVGLNILLVELGGGIGGFEVSFFGGLVGEILDHGAALVLSIGDFDVIGLDDVGVFRFFEDFGGE